MDQVSFRFRRAIATRLGLCDVKPVLASEKHAKRGGDLPVTIALVSRQKCPRVAQYIAPQLRRLFQAEETFDGDHEIGLAPVAVQWRVKSRLR